MEEWKALQSLPDDKQIVIKKGYCVVLWDRDDYLREAEWQLKDKKIYRSITFNDKLIEDVTERSHKMFKDLRRGGHLSEKQLNYYSLKYKRTCNLGKLNVLPKIHKRLYQKDRSFLIVAPPQRKYQNFLIIISNLSCRVVGLILGIEEIL